MGEEMTSEHEMAGTDVEDASQAPTGIQAPERMAGTTTDQTANRYMLQTVIMTVAVCLFFVTMGSLASFMRPVNAAPVTGLHTGKGICADVTQFAKVFNSSQSPSGFNAGRVRASGAWAKGISEEVRDPAGAAVLASLAKMLTSYRGTNSSMFAAKISPVLQQVTPVVVKACPQLLQH